MNTAIWKLIKMAYGSLLRPLVVEKVQSTDVKWDDYLLSVLDKIFDYTE